MTTFQPLNSDESSLSAAETKAAVSELYVSKPFRVVNRNLVDPVRPTDPRFFLFSFIPASGATPDAESGIYGVAKVRAVGYTPEECDARAKDIIQNVDSTNSIFTGIVGMPFPLTTTGKSHETTEVDLSKQTEKIISDNVRAKRKAAEKELREMEERKAALVKEDGTINDDISPQELYIQNRVKLAHLKYAKSEHETKHKECVLCIEKTRQTLIDMNKENPEYEKVFVEKYKEGRRKAHIPQDTDFTGFMKYFLDPVDE